MRRDQILHQQEPILAGNLPPADLPNPHEPVRSEETGSDGHSGTWPTSSYATITEDEENQRTTSPLRRDKSAILHFNGHANNTTTPTTPSSGHTNQEALTLETLQGTQRTAILPRWVARLLGPFLK
jgi:phospho-N-acetylmuramoyl-pentapeptide-transferase